MAQRQRSAPIPDSYSRRSHRLLVSVILATLASPIAGLAQSQPQAAHRLGEEASRTKPCYDDSSYDNFIRSVATGSLGKVGPDAEPVELIISWMQGDERVVAPLTGIDCIWGRFRFAWDDIKVTAAGNAYTGFRGESNGISAPIRLPEGDLARLQQFLARLPGDGKRLPPAGHRVIVKVASGGIISVRVYDRAELPDEVIELIRSTDSRIEISTPHFQPSKVWTAGELRKGAASSLALNASDIGQDSMSGSYRLVAESTEQSLLAVSSFFSRGSLLRIYNASADEPVYELSFPPNGRRVTSATYLGFSPGGSQFLLETDLPEMRIYETKTWKQIAGVWIPPGSVRYVPSPDWSRGVALGAGGEAAIWDARAHSRIAAISTNGRVQAASFSPKGEQLAVTSGAEYYRAEKLSLWDSSNGHLLRELWPVQWRATVQGQPLWWGNGQFLVAHFKPFIGLGANGIWDVRTGRFQGTLAGCSSSNLFVEHERLFQNCPSGEVMEWSVEGIRGHALELTGRLPR